MTEETASTRCPWKIHWGVSQESTTQCDKPAHVKSVRIVPAEMGLFRAEVDGDPLHEGPSGYMQGQRIDWRAGDRREYTGDWPGPCPKLPRPMKCTLHDGHHGRCAP